MVSSSTSSRFEHTGNLFSVDLLDASGEIRGTFFKETADKVFPLLEEGKVYTFQETSGRLKPANKQVRSRRPTSVPSLQYESSPGMMDVGGLLFEFDAPRSTLH